MNLLSSAEKLLHKILGNELDFDLRNYLIKGSFYSIVIQVFSMALNLLIGIVLARLIGAEGYGNFTFAFTLLSVLCTITVFGMDDLLVREISSFQSQNNFSGIKTILKWSIIRAFIFSVFISAILFMVINYSGIVPSEKKYVFNLIITAIPFFTLTMILQAGQRGMHHVIPGQLPEKIIRPLILLFIVLFIYSYDKTFFAKYSIIAIAINIIAYAVAMAILIFQIIKFLSFEKSADHKSMQQNWPRSSFYFFIATIMAVINVRADILMLGWMKSDTDVGIYNVAARFSDFTAFALLIITPILAPSISRLFILNEKTKLQQLVSKAAKANFYFALVITMILIVLGKYPLKIFGDEFSEGYFCMILLCGGQLITTFGGPAGNILLMTGYEKLAFYAGLIGTIINIGLNFLFIPHYGINGAAAATACSLFVWNGLQTYLVFRKLKINPTILFINPKS